MSPVTLVTIRDAGPGDAAACAAVYAPYVTGTAVSFESRPPSPAGTAERIAAASATHAWVVAESDGRVVGYAYGTPFRRRPAYRWTCEVSGYVAADGWRSGVGRALYGALLDRLAALGYRTTVAAMTPPNEASAALHRALGFVEVGTLRRVGWKHGARRDLLWVQRDLGDSGDGPPSGEPT